MDVFGQPESAEIRIPKTTEQKDRIFFQRMLSEGVRNSSAYRRLKLAMDYWCALWFWPIDKADLLPTREEFLLELTLILEGNVYYTNGIKGEQLSLIPENKPKQLDLALFNELGIVDLDRLCQEHERLQLVENLAEKHRFLH